MVMCRGDTVSDRDFPPRNRTLLGKTLDVMSLSRRGNKIQRYISFRQNSGRFGPFRLCFPFRRSSSLPNMAYTGRLLSDLRLNRMFQVGTFFLAGRSQKYRPDKNVQQDKYRDR